MKLFPQPDPIPEVPAAASPEPSSSAVRTDRNRLLQLRWASLLAMAAIASIIFPWLAPAQARAPLAGVTLSLLAVNLALQAGAARWLVGRWGAFLQLVIDLAAWGGFLYFAGGVTNPAIALLLPVVAVGASILPAAQAWLLAALAVGVYSLLWTFHQPVVLADAELAMHWHLAGMWISFGFSAATMVWFIVRLNTELGRREDELAVANAARARDAYVVGLGKLAAGAAHRLGTPLGTLCILSDELLRRSDLAAEVREDLELMRAQVGHCRDILNGLAREAGQPRAQEGGVVGVPAWVEQIVGRWQRLRPGAAVTVEAGEDGVRSAIVADASLGEALHNLVDNAANANVRSAVRDAAVELRICVEGADVVVEVADRGPGIEPVPAARAVPPGAHGEGMGVGLILAQAALESHGGRLEFRPRLGGGTIACLRIPARRTCT
ncbi:ATP-binding protein [Thauera aromatica]|uniref:ATP-binding protein n=1 Tax=Thauera aromatica TaxID=59405 RepID=UPI001FFDADD3|nr:ATP-binding protein [Thauera aromatica]MCK2096747.1 ATP-binding protein [Thauera aromatica]